MIGLYGLNESLVIVEEEGLENSWDRHQRNHLALRDGLEKMGINFIVAEKDRLPQLNAVTIPDGVDDAAVRTRLLNDFDLEIGAGLGSLAGTVWRICLRGHASARIYVDFFLYSRRAVLLALFRLSHKGYLG